jgi:hypothetical protein
VDQGTCGTNHQNTTTASRDVSETLIEVQKESPHEKRQKIMVNTRVELATLALLAPRSNQLS